jgi:hypothetical protein
MVVVLCEVDVMVGERVVVISRDWSILRRLSRETLGEEVLLSEVFDR